MPVSLLFSKPQWEVIETCLILVIDQGDRGLGPDSIRDAQEILEEIRVYLDKDPKGIVDLIGEDLTDAYLRADRPQHRPGGVPRPPGAGLPHQSEGVVEP